MDKKQLLINAGLKVFSINGYNKSSINEIVDMANVAKGLLFYHFNTKKDFYLYLVDYCSQILNKIIEQDQITETDFFERIEHIMQKRIMFMIKVPYAYEFLMKAYFEDSSDICDELQKKLNNLDLGQLNLYTSTADKRKFKEPKDMNVCAKMIVWITDGIFKVPPANKAQLKHRIVELSNYIDILKQRFYKNECL